MSEKMRYVTNERGDRVGVLLDLETYDRMAHSLDLDEECLTELSTLELQALAESMLAPSAQARLDELLARNVENQLCENERAELDRLVDQVDQLTILKTRAKYTLKSLATLTEAS